VERQAAKYFTPVYDLCGRNHVRDNVARPFAC
jgi:hypothetical protein